ncbi:MAG: hypothetical protein D6742_04390 [Cyanobacteria bacterium J069]|nr:MAG: hypothetical protein D6742_04390 [Cyanobacteria bacterium J069]
MVLIELFRYLSWGKTLGKALGKTLGKTLTMPRLLHLLVEMISKGTMIRRRLRYCHYAFSIKNLLE